MAITRFFVFLFLDQIISSGQYCDTLGRMRTYDQRLYVLKTITEPTDSRKAYLEVTHVLDQRGPYVPALPFSN